MGHSDAVSVVAYAHEWLFLLLVIGISLAPWFTLRGKNQSPPGTSRVGYTCWRVFFFGFIAAGIFAWYWCTAVHWYHAHSAGDDSSDDDDDGIDDGDTLHNISHTPRIGAPSNLSSGTYIATWILIIFGLFLWKLDDVYMNEIQETEPFKMRTLYWINWILAILVHTAIAVLLFVQTAYLSAIFFTIAWVIIIVGVIAYFVGVGDNWSNAAGKMLSAARFVASQKRGK